MFSSVMFGNPVYTISAKSSEHRLEGYDRTVHMLEQLSERWADRPTFNNLRLAECYIKGEFCVILHARFADKEWVAVFQRLLEVGQREGGRPEAGIERTDWELESAPSNGYESCEQSVVLVRNVQIVDDPKGFVPSLVRFGCVNCIYRSLRHAAYFSRIHSFVFRGAVEDWERSPARGDSPVDDHKLVCQMIQSTPQIVNNVSGDKTDLKWGWFQIGDIVSVVSRLWIGITPDGIGFRVNEFCASDPQFIDVLYGPFDLYLYDS